MMAFGLTGKKSVRRAEKEARRRGHNLREGAEEFADQAADTLLEGYDRAREVGRRVSDAAHHGYEGSRELAHRHVERQPLVALLIAVGVGYLMAWLMHARR